MKITILTLFPKMFGGFLSESIIGRAQQNQLINIEITDLRRWGIGKHKQVDDTPYGGGAGMVMKVDVIGNAIRDIRSKNDKVILLTPQGKKFSQKIARDLAKGEKDILLICGHYEGFDERIREYVDEEISIGDFVLTGGELPAAVITDAVVRLIPGVLGKDESSESETFEAGLLEYPQYTKPEEFEGKKVPDVLKSGHHAEIEKWRISESKKRTKIRRPDLL